MKLMSDSQWASYAQAVRRKSEAKSAWAHAKREYANVRVRHALGIDQNDPQGILRAACAWQAAVDELGLAVAELKALKRDHVGNTSSVREVAP